MAGEAAGETGRTDWRHWAAFAAVLAVAAALRCWDLGARSLWIDEGYSWFQASGGLADVFARTAEDNYPPLHNLILWAVIRLAGDGEAVMRAPSAVFATLNVAAVFLLGRRMAGPAAGLAAAMLLTLAPMEIGQAHQVRMYAQFSLAATLHLWAALGFLERPGRRRAALCAVTALAVLSSHLYGTFLFAATGAAMAGALLLRRHHPALLRWCVAQGAALFLFLPWLFILLSRAGAVVEEGFWIPAPDTAYLRDTALAILTAPAAILAAVTLAASVVLWLWRREVRADALVVLAAVLLPLAVALGLSLALRPILADRYMIFAAPLTLALAAALLMRLPVPRWLRGAAVLAVAALMAPGAFAAVHHDPPWFSDWRALAARQAELEGPDDATLVYPPNALHAYRYYAGPQRPVLRPPTRGEVLRPPQRDGRVWIALRGTEQGLVDEIAAAYAADGFRLEREEAFKNCRLLAFRRR